MWNVRFSMSDTGHEGRMWRFNYDLDAICRDLQEKQKRGKQKVVYLPPKHPRK